MWNEFYIDNDIPREVRQEIFDALRIAGIRWNGDINELEFLQRVYDLIDYPSHDYRFDNAAGDIYQHRVNNRDGSDDWVYSDPRFDLLNCSDKDFFRFICEMLHPVVRRSSKEIEHLLDIFNTHLLPYSYQIAPTREIGGKPIYTALIINPDEEDQDDDGSIATTIDEIQQVDERLDLAEGESGLQTTDPAPKAFVSYSWDSDEHRDWVRTLATRLRSKDGISVVCDHWYLKPGMEITRFISEAIANNQYILIVCTERYKQRADAGEGGVGYEGTIISGEIFSGIPMSEGQEKYFIPIFRGLDWLESAPDYLRSRARIDLRGDSYDEEEYRKLVLMIHDEWPEPPPVARKL